MFELRFVTEFRETALMNPTGDFRKAELAQTEETQSNLHPCEASIVEILSL